MTTQPASIREWYRLSNRTGSFVDALRYLDLAALQTALQHDTAEPPSGRLQRTPRKPLPSLSEVRKASPNEQTLQWMFLLRGYFEKLEQTILWRELPTSCEQQKRQGSADLLVWDPAARQPVIVELKCATAGDPLTRVVLEALAHWTFYVRHAAEFRDQLAGYGARALQLPRIAIAAPKRYFHETERRSAERRQEYQMALGWIAGLQSSGLVEIDLCAVDDNWFYTGPRFSLERL